MANQPAKEAGEFNLIIAEVEGSKLNDAAREFAGAFSLDETIAQQICKSAPIIFAQKLTKSEVKAITPKLTELSAKGIEFRVTARVAQKMPKVNWPIRPQFTAGGAGGANGLAFEWENNAFVCPNCNETFLFRRMGQLKLAEAPAASEAPKAAAAPAPAKAAPAPKPAPKPAPPPARAPAPAEELEFAEPEPAGQLEGVEGVEPLGESESLELPGSVEEINLSESDVASPAESPVVPLEAEAEPSGKGAALQAPQETATELSTEPEEVTAPTVAAEEQGAPATAVDGEAYNVFLSKITDSSKRDKAAELIAKVKGCSLGEAKELTTRLVIPLAKNVSKEQADDILNQFKKMKIFGRMTKVK